MKLDYQIKWQLYGEVSAASGMNDPRRPHPGDRSSRPGHIDNTHAYSPSASSGQWSGSCGRASDLPRWGSHRLQHHTMSMSLIEVYV